VVWAKAAERERLNTRAAWTITQASLGKGDFFKEREGELIGRGRGEFLNLRAHEYR
jgi:hypothetical protein